MTLCNASILISPRYIKLCWKRSVSRIAFLQENFLFILNLAGKVYKDVTQIPNMLGKLYLEYLHRSVLLLSIPLN